ncbi:MAG: DUF3616 domain-containing protein [Cyanobacteria bacterium P01_C01_bin.69]
MPDGFLLSRVLLEFDSKSKDLIEQISAIARTPDGSLWVGSDELRILERLSETAPGIYGKHERFEASDFVKLFESPADKPPSKKQPSKKQPSKKQPSEIDIEGMAYADGYLWFVGSHSTKRKKPDGKKRKKDIRALSTIETERNRYLLARVPIVNGQPVKSCQLSDGKKNKLTAATLEQSGTTNPLMSALEQDEHLGPFVQGNIPSKDNGLDIEGLAVRGNAVYLGLRGPVLRGWAVILELELEAKDSETLSLKEIGKKGEVYRKHFVDLNGLGVRDLCVQGEHLIILAGPTMTLAGAMQVFRLKNLLDHSKDSIWSQEVDAEADAEADALSLLFNLPAAQGTDSQDTDKAEGITLVPCLGYDSAVMVVHDAPSQTRRPNAQSLFADVYRLPE